MAFNMKGSTFYGKAGAFKQTTDNKSAKQIAADKAYSAQMNQEGQVDFSAGDYQDKNLDTALDGESVDRGPGSEWMEGRHAGTGGSYDEAMKARQRYLDMSDEDFESMTTKSDKASARYKAKEEARKTEGDARRAATKAKNDAGYNRMNRRQQQKFQEANPQFFQ